MTTFRIGLAAGIAGLALVCVLFLTPAFGSSSSTGQCQDWEVSVYLAEFLADCQGKNKLPMADKGDSCRMPKGWEPFASMGGDVKGSWIYLRRCAK